MSRRVELRRLWLAHCKAFGFIPWKQWTAPKDGAK
ncbi:hypothetical protein Gobs01_00523 [Geodermatophilus obscurus DSM 43160]|uniref:Uncharacterized protein n=1 Tax=Geodermatophilus obscurus (strain ATCC 25078 / DSM 43160 / JCM 3152 / CCUG 61914 / KCC A-0152 / KCTC 9177 / NBRC 13315 / NRRL B-3577 / G-20) TaxID=526225 RepID=D2S868_GEOOG|nr:hypothetical protein Gobs_0720 [Geodermatophilus obscurus DSM 43160]